MAFRHLVTYLPGMMFGLLMVVFPEPVRAWGPGFHFYLAHHLLEAGLVTSALSKLLDRNTLSYLYGNIVADLVVGKNFIDIEDHSHHWDVGRQLRDHAATDSERAFAMGFWTHLAADTVAHNIFLREQQEKGFSSNRFGHAYWELQAERWVPGKYHEDVSGLLDRDFEAQQTLLQASIPKTVLPFRLNWWMMEGVLHLTGRGAYRSLGSFMDRYSSPTLPDAEMEEYVDLCLTRMEESLDGYENRITRINPIGKGGRFLP